MTIMNILVMTMTTVCNKVNNLLRVVFFLLTHHIFQPIAVETLGPINESARAFLDDLGRRISVLSVDDRAFVFISTHLCCHSAF